MDVVLQQMQSDFAERVQRLLSYLFHMDHEGSHEGLTAVLLHHECNDGISSILDAVKQIGLAEGLLDRLCTYRTSKD